MFDDTQEPKDMFSDIPETAPQPAQAAPVASPAPSTAPGAQPSAVSPQTVISPAQAMQYEAPKGGGAGFRIVVMIVVSLACIGAAGYAAYRFMIRDAVTQQVSEVIGGAETSTATDAKTTDTTDSGKGSDATGASSTTSDDAETDAGPVAVIDSDGDGLSNEEERAAGTSVAKPDTDSDGLGDREEVKVYDTDPKNADTDGDGYKDGDEVKNGYNPNGTGKLLQIPE